MSKDILNTIILSASVLALLGFSEIVYNIFKLKAEHTRKFVHVITGLITLLFPVMLGNHWLVLLMCISFGILLTITLKFNLLKSVNAINRKSAGSIAYPVAVYCCYLMFEFSGQQYEYYYLPILILAICDPIAALTGKTWPLGEYSIGNETKTMMGSAMFTLAAIAVSFTVLKLLNCDISFIHISAIALTAAFAEAVTTKGLDNLSIPFAVTACLFLMEKIQF